MRSADGDRSDRCPDAEVLAAWRDGALGARERGDVETHVADCARCQMHLAAMVRMESAAPETVPHRRDVPWWRWLVPATAVATALLVWAIVAPTSPPAVAPPPPSAPTAATQPQDAPSQTQPEPQRQRFGAPSTLARRGDRGAAEEDKRAKNEVREQREELSSPAEAPAAAAPPPAAALESTTPMLRAADAVAPIPGDAIHVERAPDGRVTWQVERGTLSEQVTAASSPSPSVVWLVGRAGLVLVPIEGGWRRVTIPERADLVAVTAIDGIHATVRAADGREFQTLDGGITWIAAPLQDSPAAPF